MRQAVPRAKLCPHKGRHIHVSFLNAFMCFSRPAQNIFQVFAFTQSNKKVLLRERKTHTACGISSTPSAALSGCGTYPGWGYLLWMGGAGGTYSSWVPTLARRYLPWLGGTEGVPHSWDGGTP